MKSVKTGLVLALSALLMACGGHGFEGEYEIKAGANNRTMETLMGMVGGGPSKMVIGSDYVESEGKRQDLEKIFVRESGGTKYLVFKDKQADEEVWRILDDKTLESGNALMSIKLVRVN